MHTSVVTMSEEEKKGENKKQEDEKEDENGEDLMEKIKEMFPNDLLEMFTNFDIEEMMKQIKSLPTEELLKIQKMIQSMDPNMLSSYYDMFMKGPEGKNMGNMFSPLFNMANFPNREENTEQPEKTKNTISEIYDTGSHIEAVIETQKLKPDQLKMIIVKDSIKIQIQREDAKDSEEYELPLSSKIDSNTAKVGYKHGLLTIKFQKIV